MVLLMYGSNDIDWKYEKRWMEWFAIPIANIFIRDYYLQYTNFLSLRYKQSVTVNPDTTVHTLGKKEEIKTSLLLFPLTQSELAKWMR